MSPGCIMVFVARYKRYVKKSFAELDFDAAKRDVAPFLANT